MKMIILIMLFLISFNGLLYASDSSEEDLTDHLGLASLFVHDERYDEAREELALVDKSGKLFDKAKYYTIQGVLNTKTQNYDDAIINYNKAVEATKAKDFQPPEIYKKRKYLFSIGSSEVQEDVVPEFDGEKIKSEKLEKLFLYLSQAYYKVKDYSNTVKSLDQAGSKGRSNADFFNLRAVCYWKMKDHHKAIEALNMGIEYFQDEAALVKQKIYYFAELELYHAAIENTMKYIDMIEADENEYIQFAQLFSSGNRQDEAIKLLEIAKVKFPKVAKVKILLGQLFMKKNMNYTAAHFFKLGGYDDSKYLKDAVEMYRRVNKYSHAIFLNSQMTDNVEKLKQKLALYLIRNEFEKIIGLKDGLERYNILKDDNMRYAMAYAYYMIKDYEGAEYHLAKINDQVLFIKSTVIRNNIEKCRINALECM